MEVENELSMRQLNIGLQINHHDEAEAHGSVIWLVHWSIKLLEKWMLKQDVDETTINLPEK